LTQILDKVWSKTGQAGTPFVPNRRVHDATADMIDPQLSCQALARRVANRWVLVQSRFDLGVGLAHIMKRIKEVGHQLCIVGNVLEAANRSKFSGQVIGNFIGAHY
jgi:hypothetical protein